ncbi:MAG: Trk family potassium uptake protein [Spirochaetes bacterium]|nr:Trk family potassium uptake protein [Spirochaetota bacterium]
MILKLFKLIFNKITNQPYRLVLSSFAAVIIIGSILLYLPVSAAGKNISYMDALFTSASAVCVTGLVVVDTGSFFSMGGQIIILLLIQIGGLGVMTLSTLFLFYLKGKFGIGSREVIQETISSFDIVDIGLLLKSVLIFTFTCEAAGAVLLTIRFLFDMPFSAAIYNAVFHSISAFCNAGFSTFSDSLVAYRSDIFVNVIIIFLIIIGGIGFIVNYELVKNWNKKFSFRALSLHSKIVISVSGALIAVGTVLILFFEYSVSMKEFDFSTKILAAFFQSVTSRTAGFNTIDLYSFSIPSIFVIVGLMFIGASPSSCGGGIKTSTIAVVLAFIRSRINGQKNINLFHNTLPFNVISKAIVIVVFGISTVVFFSFLISIFEISNTSFSDNGTRFIQIFFEVVSAFGTVGLSTGITPELSFVSRVLLVILMLMGRVGPLTIALSIGSKEAVDIRYVEDTIIIG